MQSTGPGPKSVAATRASDQAANALALAQRAQANFHNLDGAIKKAVVSLYTNGPSSLTVNPAAGDGRG